jgi:hypothetical protein
VQFNWLQTHHDAGAGVSVRVQGLCVLCTRVHLHECVLLSVGACVGASGLANACVYGECE